MLWIGLCFPRSLSNAANSKIDPSPGFAAVQRLWRAHSLTESSQLCVSLITAGLTKNCGSAELLSASVRP